MASFIPPVERKLRGVYQDGRLRRFLHQSTDQAKISLPRNHQCHSRATPELAIYRRRPQRVRLQLAFTTGNRFKVELYVDTGNRQVNKVAYDHLFEYKSEIEATVGHPLDWDRLESAKACRISSYYAESATILDEPEILDTVTDWAIEEIKRFRDVFAKESKTLSLIATTLDEGDPGGSEPPAQHTTQ